MLFNFYFHLTRGEDLTKAESVVAPTCKLKVNNPQSCPSVSFSGIFELGSRENEVSFFWWKKTKCGDWEVTVSCHGEKSGLLRIRVT